MKVFISFSSKDLQVAERLYADLITAGAEVYQFGKSERAGVSSWEQVLAWINDSDVFIVLVSQSSLKSQAVKDEIDQASYSRSNSDGRKPAELIPAIIEPGAKPPLLVERFATLDLMAYRTGVSRLISQLRLTPTHASGVAMASLPDFSKLFSKYKALSPAPRPATLWSKEAEKLLHNYNAVKPPDANPEAEKKHIDALLADKPSKYDAPFMATLERTPTLQGLVRDAEKRRSELSLRSKLLSLDLPATYPGLLNRVTNRLDTPEVSVVLGFLSWTTVARALRYVVERSESRSFDRAEVVYDGDKTSHSVLGDVFNAKAGDPAGRRYFRVKATGLGADSAWSEVVSQFGLKSSRNA